MRKGFTYHHYESPDFAQHIAPLGAKTVRIEVPWNRVEPQDGIIDWEGFGFCDEQIRGCIAAGALPIIVPLYPCPPWARAWDHETAPPADPSKYGRFVKFLAKRWSKNRGFEIWNEPNTARFWGGRAPDSTLYTRMLNQAFNKVKEVADYRVILGGVAPYQPDPNNDNQFVKRVLRGGGKADAVAIHPYFNVPACLDRMRRATNKPLVATEFGWTTCSQRPPCVGEADQAAHLSTELKQLNGNVTDAIVYVLRDPWDTDDAEGRFGLVRRDQTLKPAYDVLRKFQP